MGQTETTDAFNAEAARLMVGLDELCKGSEMNVVLAAVTNLFSMKLYQSAVGKRRSDLDLTVKHHFVIVERLIDNNCNQRADGKTIDQYLSEGRDQ